MEWLQVAEGVTVTLNQPWCPANHQNGGDATGVITYPDYFY
jgi:hypothetical protein